MEANGLLCFACDVVPAWRATSHPLIEGVLKVERVVEGVERNDTAVVGDIDEEVDWVADFGDGSRFSE